MGRLLRSRVSLDHDGNEVYVMAGPPRGLHEIPKIKIGRCGNRMILNPPVLEADRHRDGSVYCDTADGSK